MFILYHTVRWLYKRYQNTLEGKIEMIFNSSYKF